MSYSNCSQCHTTTSQHKGHGLCIRCYNRQYDHSPTGREQYKRKMLSPEKTLKRHLRCHKYYLHHKRQAKQNAKKWVRNHPDTRKIVSSNCCHKRRLKYKDGDVSSSFLLNLYKTTTICALCGIELIDNGKLPNGRNLDHIIPLSIGGRHTASNIRYICRTCNLTRADGRLRLHLFTRKS
jgi:hypothetical protein